MAAMDRAGRAVQIVEVNDSRENHTYKLKEQALK
jgi:hypothetical protein